MTDAELREKVNGIFQEVFDDDKLQIQNEMTAKDVEEWDSLNHINLIVAVERAFKIKFTTKEVSNLANVGEFLAVIKSKLG